MEFKSGSASDVSHRYLWGPHVDQLFADEQVTTTGSAENAIWTLGDNLGTTRDISERFRSTMPTRAPKSLAPVERSRSAAVCAFSEDFSLHSEAIRDYLDLKAC